MTPDELEKRAKDFALRVMKVVDALPNTAAGRSIANQLVRSGTAVPANYRAARRARSRKEFVARLGVVVEEADESEFWLEMIIDARLLRDERVRPLLTEAGELVKILSSSRGLRDPPTENRQIAKSPNREITATMASDEEHITIDPELLDILRCPLTRSRLRQEGDWLVAEQPEGAGLRYPIEDGIPILLIERATLPEGVASIEQFKQQHPDHVAE
jgi:four helix bundle protein